MANANKTRQELSNMFLAALKEDRIPWAASWMTASPRNPVSRITYRGVNALMLSAVSMEKGYTDPRWCTFLQAKSKDWKILKGSKATRIEYWAYFDPKLKKMLSWSEANRISRDDPQRFKTLTMRGRSSLVFNAAQIQGMPPLESYQTDIGQLRAQRDVLLSNMKLSYREQGDRAYYSPSNDQVTLPPESHFENVYGYMGTLLHECGHATGHPSRLRRDLSGGFGSPEYAREELRAEIASAFTAQTLGLQMPEKELQQHLDRHKSYIQSWIQVLEDQPNELFSAIRDAGDISNYLIQAGEFSRPAQAQYLDEPLDFQHSGMDYHMENNFLRGGLTLTAAGQGTVADLEHCQDFQAHRRDIAEIVLQEGVRGIDNYAFYKLPELQKVTLPESLQRIGVCAMDECSRHQEIEYHGSGEQWDSIHKAPGFLSRSWPQERLATEPDPEILKARQAPPQAQPEGAYAVISWDQPTATSHSATAPDEAQARAAAQAQFLAGATGVMVYDKLQNRLLHVYGYMRDELIPEDARPVVEVKEFRVQDYMLQGRALGQGLDEWAEIRQAGERRYLRTGSVVTGDRVEHTLTGPEMERLATWERQGPATFHPAAEAAPEPENDFEMD